MKNYAYIDFEYNGTTKAQLNLVCCSILYKGEVREYWLHNCGNSHLKLADYIQRLHEEGVVLVSWNVEAEARSFISLGFDRPQDFRWIDLFLEYRMLTNHNHKLAYGTQLIKGKFKYVNPPKPKWQREEGEKGSSKTEHNLAAGLYKLLGVKLDTSHKTMMRDLIISAPKKFSGKERKDITAYCTSDIKYLPAAYDAMIKEYRKLLPVKELKLLKKEMLLRGDYAARTAVMVSDGYPINVKQTKNFAASVPFIIEEIQEEINANFPDIKPFKKKKDLSYSWNQVATREWIDTLDIDKWMKTDTGKNSLSLDAFTKHFNFSHNYPTNNLGAQFVRYLKTKQSLNGFRTNAKASDKTLWSYLGKDGMVRPYMNIYGSQSARSQPAATGFIPLKSAWMRALIQPPKGMAIGAIDYKSEEFLISALTSKDMNMVNAYMSGDVYLYFAKLAGAVPMDGLKKDYKSQRDKFKSTTLGISYLMTKYGLCKKLTNDTGVFHDEEDAQELIDLFDEAYPDFSEWRTEIVEQYRCDEYLKLPCGWYMFGDNANFRSVANMPIQGCGSSIMRRAVALAQDAGLQVIFTLHDALYILFDKDNYKALDILADCMQTAFRDCFDGDMKQYANVGLDANIWGPDYPEIEDKIKTEKGLELKRQQIYIDERAIDDYNKFKKYFNNCFDYDL